MAQRLAEIADRWKTFGIFGLIYYLCPKKDILNNLGLQQDPYDAREQL